MDLPPPQKNEKIYIKGFLKKNLSLNFKFWGGGEMEPIDKITNQFINSGLDFHFFIVIFN